MTPGACDVGSPAPGPRPPNPWRGGERAGFPSPGMCGDTCVCAGPGGAAAGGDRTGGWDPGPSVLWSRLVAIGRPEPVTPLSPLLSG